MVKYKYMDEAAFPRPVRISFAEAEQCRGQMEGVMFEDSRLLDQVRA